MCEDFSATYKVEKDDDVLLSAKTGEKTSLVNLVKLDGDAFDDDAIDEPLMIGNWKDFEKPKKLVIISVARNLDKENDKVSVHFILCNREKEKKFSIELPADYGKKREIRATFTLKHK